MLIAGDDHLPTTWPESQAGNRSPGIAPEERERVFDRFYRALGTKTSGTGLGLAIVKRIVDIHHGTIAIDDGLDGRGTTFRIRLPKLGAAAAAV